MRLDSYRRGRSADNTAQGQIEYFEKGKHRWISSDQRSTVNVFVMTQVLEYCEHHRGEQLPTTDAGSQSGTYEFHEISEWDQKFIAVESETLYELVVAANNLDIEPLLLALILGSFGISDFLDSDLTAETAFNMVKGKGPEEARKILRI